MNFFPLKKDSNEIYNLPKFDLVSKTEGFLAEFAEKLAALKSIETCKNR